MEKGDLFYNMFSSQNLLVSGNTLYSVTVEQPNTRQIMVKQSLLNLCKSGILGDDNMAHSIQKSSQTEV